MKTILLLCSFTCFSLFSNPFLIDVEEKNTFSDQEWIKIQDKLREVQLLDVIKAAYPNHSSFKFFWQKPLVQNLNDFQGRICRGINQTLINLEKEKKPLKKLSQINQGGEYCIVSFASYNGPYAELMQTIPEELKQTGFNGYFLSLTGGFPNPTGKEIRYSGVPYSFKIFALLEAEKLGFQKVLWVDAAMQVLKDPTPLFNWIEKTDSFFQSRKNGKRYLLPQTRDILLQETGSDMYETPCARAQIIGLNLKAPHVKKLIEDYYHLVELGTPFMSCFPEEFVLGALLAKDSSKWPFQPFEKLVQKEGKLHGKTKEWAKSEGFFFLLRNH